MLSTLPSSIIREANRKNRTRTRLIQEQKKTELAIIFSHSRYWICFGLSLLLLSLLLSDFYICLFFSAALPLLILFSVFMFLLVSSLDSVCILFCSSLHAGPVLFCLVLFLLLSALFRTPGLLFHSLSSASHGSPSWPFALSFPFTSIAFAPSNWISLFLLCLPFCCFSCFSSQPYHLTGEKQTVKWNNH